MKRDDPHSPGYFCSAHASDQDQGEDQRKSVHRSIIWEMASIGGICKRFGFPIYRLSLVGLAYLETVAGALWIQALEHVHHRMRTARR